MEDSHALGDSSNAMPGSRLPKVPGRVPLEDRGTAVELDIMKKRCSQEPDISGRQHDFFISDPADGGIKGSDTFRQVQLQSSPQTSSRSHDGIEENNPNVQYFRQEFLIQQVKHLEKQLNASCERNATLEQKVNELADSCNHEADYQTTRATEGKLAEKAKIDALRKEHQRLQAENQKLQAETNTLRSENRGLRAELSDARGHIFSLQPYTKDLTPEEVGSDYDGVVNGIMNWMGRLMDPILDSPERTDEVLAAARKRPETQRLREFMYQQDLARASMWPETDIDIATAIVMRFVHDQIFQGGKLFGAVPELERHLNLMEKSMSTCVEPKRDLYAVRTWQAEALTAIISLPDYQKAREARAKELSVELAGLFRFFCDPKDPKRFANLCAAFREHVITPCVVLHERMLTSVHHFYLDLNPFCVWNPHQDIVTSPEFFENLHRLKCENILQNRKPFSITKVNPKPTKDQLLEGLVRIATIVPALYLRQVGKGDSIKEPSLVRKQQVLVAWGSQEKRDKFQTNGEHTLLRRIYCSPRERDRSYTDMLKGPWS